MSSAKDYAFRLLGLRRMTEYEIRQKLMLRHYPQDEIEEAIAACLHYGYINDDQYVSDYISDAFRIKEWGKNKIFIALRKKGIPSDVINEKIASCSVDERDILKRLFERKYRSAQSLSWPDKQKIAAQLARRGFSYPLISEIIQEEVAFEENYE